MTRQQLLLIVLLAWALVMIVPDLLRVVQPFVRSASTPTMTA